MFLSRLAAGHRYFLAAGLVLSCFGFRFFLSFFCELFPLPMFHSPVGWRAPCGPHHPFNRQKSPLRSINKPDFFVACLRLRALSVRRAWATQPNGVPA